MASAFKDLTLWWRRKAYIKVSFKIEKFYILREKPFLGGEGMPRKAMWGGGGNEAEAQWMSGLGSNIFEDQEYSQQKEEHVDKVIKKWDH